MSWAFQPLAPAAAELLASAGSADATDAAVALRWSTVTMLSKSTVKGPTNTLDTRQERQWATVWTDFVPPQVVSVDAGLASATGTAYNTPNLIKPQAGLVSASGTAYTVASINIKVSAELVSATGTAYATPNLTKPTAGLASATGTAYNVSSINIKVSAEVASATATAYDTPNLVKPTAGLASGSGTAYDATISATQAVFPDAGLVSASGTAYNVAVSIKVSAGLVSATGTAYGTANLVKPNAGLATQATATAYDATITASTAVAPDAELVSATGTAYDATVSVKPQGGLASATGTAYTVGSITATVTTTGVAQATATAYNPAATLKPNAELVSASGTAYTTTTSTKPTAGLASASGTAYTVGSITIAFTAGLASGTGTAYNTPNLVAPTAGVAQATGTAYDATVDAYPATYAPAGLATAVGVAYNPTISTSSGLISAYPDVALATGAAYQVAISMGVQVGLATASATAYNASVSVRPTAEVAQATGDAHNAIKFNEAEPTAASATATGYDVAVSISVNAGTATQATATAYNASVVAYPVTLAGAGLASATGTASDALAAIKPTAGVASVSGTAYDPSVVAHPYVNVSAGLASATGSSYLASIAVKPQPGLASATGTAYLALISLQPTAGAPSASGTAYNPATADTTGSGYGSATATAQPPAMGLAINAGSASGSATAHDATALGVEYVRALAGVATATATAYQVAKIVKEYDWPTASITVAAQTLVVTVAGAVTLVAATATATAQTLTVTPSLATTILGVATGAYAAQTLTVTPGTSSATLVAATTTAAPVTLTSTNDISKLVDHHAAALGFQSIGQRTLIIPSGALDDKDRPWALRGYDRGFVATPVTTATVTIAAQDLTTTAGAASQNLGAATVTVAAIQFGLNGQEMDLPSAATVTLQGQTLVPQGGAISVTLDSAVSVTISARDLSATNNPRLAPATVGITAQTMVPEILRGSISQFFPGPIQVFQGVLTTQNDALYTVPQGFFLMIKEITLQKIGVGVSATRLWSVPLSQNTSTANAFMYDVPVVDYIDQKMDMVLSAGERLYARCAADGQVVCRIDGYLLSNKSLPTPRVFFRGLVSDTYAEVAVTDLSAVGMVKFISIANTTGTERTIDISTTVSGIDPADSGAIRRSLAVPGNSSVFIPMSMVLKVSEALAVKADVGGALSLNISGATAPRSVAVLSKTEIRPTNYAVNHMIPRDSIDYDSTTLWPDWLFDDSSYRALVTGDFQGTTDEIFRWAASKWDINVDLIRAVAVQESAWDARTNGDGGLSFGLMQVKPSAAGNVGTSVATVSSAWNVDYWCAWFRTVYDGKGKLWRDRPDLTNRAYAAGDLWGSVESWYTGVGPSEASAWYSANIRRYIETRPWETDPDFIHQVGNWTWVPSGGNVGATVLAHAGVATAHATVHGAAIDASPDSHPGVASVTASAHNATVSASPPAKYIIKTGQDVLNPTQLAARFAVAESRPFDGCGIVLPGVSDAVFSSTPLSVGTVDAALAPLNGLTFTRLQKRFAMCYITPPNGENNFGGDTQWATAASNFAHLATSVRNHGFTGIIFDNEAYFGAMWEGPSTDQAAAHARGVQVMAAAIAAVPTIEVLAFYGSWISDPNTSGAYAAAGVSYPDFSPYVPNQGAFFSGMVHATIGTGAKIIDGSENYGIRTVGEFQGVYDWNKTGVAASAGFIPSGDRSSYGPTVSVSFGIYDQAAHGKTMDSSIFTTTIERAAVRADEYVWLYTETYDWWRDDSGRPYVTQEWLDAATAAWTP